MSDKKLETYIMNHLNFPLKVDGKSKRFNIGDQIRMTEAQASFGLKRGFLRRKSDEPVAVVSETKKEK